METYDSLSKKISELTEFLKKLISTVLTLKDSGKTEESIEQVNQGLMQALDLNIEKITNTPPEHFISDLIADNKLNTINLDLLADLFFHSAKILEIQMEKEQAKRLFSRSLKIYQYLLKAERDFPYERHLRVEELKKIVLK